MGAAHRATIRWNRTTSCAGCAASDGPAPRTLAQALEIVPALFMDGPPAALRQLVDWMDAFPESAHGPVWLKAFEAGYQQHLFGMLLRGSAKLQPSGPAHLPPLRPHSQLVFCIDVRSEPFRRHLESTGAHDTDGFAGFFAVFIRYRAWGKEHETEQFPVIMRAKNEVREFPRSYLDHFISKHQSRAKLVHAGHTLLHDLKENVVTPYVMVESLGWFYALPMLGKTVLPALYKRMTGWVRRLFVPPIATSLTVDKLLPAETEEMIVSEQRALIWKALRDRLDLHGSRVNSEFVEALRRQALDEDTPVEPFLSNAAKAVDLSAEHLTAFLEELRRQYRINRRAASRQKERITRTGFTLEEQVITVETALRMMGLVKNFARLVLFCAHGSTTDNNPFESALDCGACGGNEGKPNARVLAAMANRPPVRERLAKRGIEIPPDTHFLAGQMDTTTDEVQLFDLEDVPPTHRKDVARLFDDLREAGQLTSQERCTRFPDVNAVLPVHRRRHRWPLAAPIGARCDRNGAFPAIRPSSSADGTSPKGSTCPDASSCTPMTIGKIRPAAGSKCCSPRHKWWPSGSTWNIIFQPWTMMSMAAGARSITTWSGAWGLCPVPGATFGSA